MTRATFGATAGDFVSFIGPGRTLRVGSATLTIWSAATGGTQYTDLLLNGSPVTSIPVGSDGQVPAFQGPDGVSDVWADAGGGARVRLIPDLAGALADSDGTISDLVDDSGSDTHAALSTLIATQAPGAVPAASTTTQGKVELATTAETTAGTDAARAVTPAALAATTAPIKGAGVAGFIQRMQAGENVKITCVGDSILEGLTTTTPATDSAMVKLGAALASRFGITVTVTNHAESGFTAARAGLGGNFAAAIAEDPDLIVISAFDKNDIGADVYGQYAPGYPLALSNAAIERLIRDVRTQRPKAAIVLMTTNPYAAGNSSNPYQVAKDASVKRLAGALGVEVVDCYQAFLDVPGGYASLMADDTHPNTAGHQLIADTLLEHFPNRGFPPGGRPASIPALGYYHPEYVDTSVGVSGYMGGTSPGSRFSGKHVWSISGSGWTLDGSSRDVSSTPGDYMEHTFYGTESLVQLDTTAALGLHLKITVDGDEVVTNQDMTLGKQGIYFITGASGLTAGTHTVRYTIVSGTFKISNVTALAAPAAVVAVSGRQVIPATAGTTTLTASYANIAQATVALGSAPVDLMISWRVQYRNSGAMTADRRIQVRPKFDLADISATSLADIPIPTASATSTRAPVQGSALVKNASGTKDFRIDAKVTDATDTIQVVSWQMDVLIIPAS